jgi:transcriptional regulator
MGKDYQTIKIWKTTLKRLRYIHAETGESMVKILERLIKEEYEKKKKVSKD